MPSGRSDRVSDRTMQQGGLGQRYPVGSLVARLEALLTAGVVTGNDIKESIISSRPANKAEDVRVQPKMISLTLYRSCRHPVTWHRLVIDRSISSSMAVLYIDAVACPCRLAFRRRASEESKLRRSDLACDIGRERTSTDLRMSVLITAHHRRRLAVQCLGFASSSP